MISKLLTCKQLDNKFNNKNNKHPYHQSSKDMNKNQEKSNLLIY